jgi:hypothetical protein
MIKLIESAVSTVAPDDEAEAEATPCSTEKRASDRKAAHGRCG